MKTINTRKIAGVALAMAAVASLASLATPTEVANAAASPTCDMGTVVLTLQDAQTGVGIPGADYRLNTANSVFVKGGDFRHEKDAFKNAFTNYMETQAPGGTFNASAIGTAFDAASQETLGTTKAPYPYNTNTESGKTLWQADNDGSVAAFRADAANRLAKLKAAQDAYAGFVGVDARFDADISEAVADMQAVVDATDAALVEPDLTAFQGQLNTLLDPNNWHYGIDTTPSVELKDRVVWNVLPGNGMGPIFADANAFAAAQIGATNVGSITTQGGGVERLTVFSVANDYLDAGTRGNLTCSQMTVDLTETQAAGGYVLDPATYSAAMPPFGGGVMGSGEITLTNLRATVQDDPTPPVRTTTGL